MVSIPELEFDSSSISISRGGRYFKKLKIKCSPFVVAVTVITSQDGFAVGAAVFDSEVGSERLTR